MRFYRRARFKSVYEPHVDQAGQRASRLPLVSLTAALVLGAAACGTNSADSADPGTADPVATDPEATVAAPPLADDGPAVSDHLFPDLDVVSVHTGETLNLAEELSGGGEPILLWFWAPH